MRFYYHGLLNALRFFKSLHLLKLALFDILYETLHFNCIPLGSCCCPFSFFAWWSHSYLPMAYYVKKLSCRSNSKQDVKKYEKRGNGNNAESKVNFYSFLHPLFNSSVCVCVKPTNIGVCLISSICIDYRQLLSYMDKIIFDCGHVLMRISAAP